MTNNKDLLNYWIKRQLKDCMLYEYICSQCGYSAREISEKCPCCNRDMRLNLMDGVKVVVISDKRIDWRYKFGNDE